MPIIADAVVVRVEEGKYKQEAVLTPPPPATNPNHAATTTSTAIVSAGNFSPIVSTKPATLTAPTNLYQLGRGSAGLQCPHCKRQTITVVRDFIGVGTVVAIVILAVFFWPLCWLPLCIPSCKRTHHFCGQSTCGRKVGETSVCD
jgi:hypothetical protein